jgi:hypothetical protein
MLNPWKPFRRAFLAAGVLALFACQDEPSPLGPNEERAPSFVEVNGVKLVTIAPGRGLEPAGAEQVATRIENNAGATLTTSDARLVITPGSMSQADVEVRMETEFASGFVQFKFGPSGLQFAPAATLTVSAAKANTSGINLNSLRIAGASDNANDWQLVGGVYDPIAGTVTARVSHFSRYALCVE